MRREDDELNDLIHRAIEDCQSFIENYNLELSYYKKNLKALDDNKPLFFMKRKLRNYENKREEMLKSIATCNARIKEESEVINKLQNSLGNAK